MFLHLPGKCLASSVALWSTMMRLGVGEYLPEMIWNTEQHTGHEFGWAGVLIGIQVTSRSQLFLLSLSLNALDRM